MDGIKLDPDRIIHKFFIVIIVNCQFNIWALCKTNSPNSIFRTHFSLKLIIPAIAGRLGPAVINRSESTIAGWLKPAGQIVALIKPQFEAGRALVGKGGVVRDPEVHRAVLADLTAWASKQGHGLAGLIHSPITGPAGNVEFLAHWLPGQPSSVDVASLIEACVVVEERGSHA